jgi:hypothetical protein
MQNLASPAGFEPAAYCLGGGLKASKRPPDGAATARRRIWLHSPAPATKPDQTKIRGGRSNALEGFLLRARC